MPTLQPRGWAMKRRFTHVTSYRLIEMLVLGVLVPQEALG